jgi:hypothetical protein
MPMVAAWELQLRLAARRPPKAATPPSSESESESDAEGWGGAARRARREAEGRGKRAGTPEFTRAFRALNEDQGYRKRLAKPEPRPDGAVAWASATAEIGLGRTVASHHRSSASHQIR